jgi:hypothetical protein
MKTWIILGIVIGIIAICFVVNHFFNNLSKDEIVTGQFPKDTLESCQKQRAILMEGIKDLEVKDANS